MIKLAQDIWSSYRALPLWVQIWIFGVLVPVNFAALLFLDTPNGTLIATLAVLGIVPNAIVLVIARGFPKSMAFSHLIFWPPLLIILWPLLGAPYPTLLFVVNTVSLAFDVCDAWGWVKGNRRVPGR